MHYAPVERPPQVMEVVIEVGQPNGVFDAGVEHGCLELDEIFYKSEIGFFEFNRGNQLILGANERSGLGSAQINRRQIEIDR